MIQLSSLKEPFFKIEIGMLRKSIRISSMCVPISDLVWCLN